MSGGGLRGRGAALSLTVGMAVAVAAGPAAAAPRPRIVAPAASSAVLSPGNSRVIVTLPAGRGSYVLRVDGRTITGHLRRLGGDRYAARLPRRLARPGLHQLALAPRRAGSARTLDRAFVIARRRRPLIRVRAARRARHGTARLRLRGGERHDGRLFGFEVRLNGRDVTREFRSTAGLPQGGRLSAADGLHAGRNRLVVKASRRDGSYDVHRRTIRVPRDVPLASAGRNLRRSAGRWVRLDGSASRPSTLPSQRGARLSYRWRIVRRPDGSHARLRRPGSVRPRLRLDRRGTYRVALTVREHNRRRPERRRPPPAFTGTAPAQDVVTITATPSNPPAIGFPVYARPDAYWGGDSVTPPGPGVMIGSTYYPREDGDAYQMLTIDPVTLEVTNQSIAYQDDVVPAVNAVHTGEIVIVTGGCLACYWNDGTFNWKLDSMGIDDDDLVPDGWSGPYWAAGFTAIGVSGTAPGTGLAAGDTTPTSNPDAGNVDGYLAPNQDYPDGSDARFTFTSGSYVQFDTNTTQAGSGATSVTASIGCHKYSPVCTKLSGSVPSGESGFLVGAVDSSTLAEIDEQTFAVNTGEASTEAANQAAMADFLESYADDAGALVVVQSIGAVAPTSSSYDAWGDIAAQIEALGGEQQTFNTIADTGTPGGYSLVGGAGVQSEPPVAETSSDLYYYKGQGASTRLVGLLEIGHSNEYEPSVSGPVTSGTTPANLDLPELAYQPSTAWPQSGTAALVAAEHWISSKLCNPGCDSDIRSEYTNSGYDFNTDASGFECEGGSYGSTSFTLADCDAVLNELALEYKYITQVRSHWFAPMTSLLTDAAISSDSSLRKVANTIDKAVYPPASSKTSISYSQIGEGVLDMLWSLDIPVLSTIAGMATGAIQIASSISTNSTGDPLANINTTAANLGVEASNNFKDTLGAITSLENIVLTDWGKLHTLAGLIQHDSKVWKLPSSSEDFSDAFEYGERQMFYSGMLPTLYQDVTIPGIYWSWSFGNPATLSCVSTPSNACGSTQSSMTQEPWDYNCPEPHEAFFLYNLQPFKGLSSQSSPTAYYQRIITPGDSSSAEWHVMASWTSGESSPTEYPPTATDTISHQLFGNPIDGKGNAGLPIQYAFDMLEPETFVCMETPS